MNKEDERTDEEAKNEELNGVRGRLNKYNSKEEELNNQGRGHPFIANLFRKERGNVFDRL